MGNLSFIYPTKNQKDFTPINISLLIKKQFPEYLVEIFDTGLVVNSKNDEIIVELWYTENYLLQEEDEDGEEVPEVLKALPVEGWFSFSYPHSYSLMKEHAKVKKYLHEYFGAYIMDEGLSLSEYFGPDYKWKELKD